MVKQSAAEQSEQSTAVDSFFASTALKEKVSTEQQQIEQSDQNLLESLPQPPTDFLNANEQNEELSIIENAFHPTIDPLQVLLP